MEEFVSNPFVENEEAKTISLHTSQLLELNKHNSRQALD